MATNKEANDLNAIDAIDAENDLFIVWDQDQNELRKATPADVMDLSGVFNVKTYGAKGDGTTDDSTAIQAAIDAAYAAGGGDIVIPSSSNPYIITGALYLMPYCRLMMGHFAEIECTANTNVIEFGGNGSQIHGGRFRNSHASFDKAIFYVEDNVTVNGVTSFFDREDQRAGAWHAYCRTNNEQYTGAAIRLVADTNNTASSVKVQWCEFGHITLHEFQYGIHLKCTEETGDVGYINGNFFHDFSGEDLTTEIYLEALGSGGPAISDNHFIRFASQVSSQSFRYIHGDTSNATGSPACGRNTFKQMAMFDWTSTASDPVAIEFDEGFTHNDVEINSLDPGEYTSFSVSNRIQTRYSLPLPVISQSLHTTTYTAAQFGSGAMFIDDQGRIFVSNGTSFVGLNGITTTEIPEGDYAFTAEELSANARYYSPSAGSGSTPYDWTMPSTLKEGSSFIIQSRAASAPIHLYPPTGKKFYEADGTAYAVDTPLKFTTRYGTARIEVTENQGCVIVWRARASVVAAP